VNNVDPANWVLVNFCVNFYSAKQCNNFACRLTCVWSLWLGE